MRNEQSMMYQHVGIDSFSSRQERHEVDRPSRKTPRNLHEKGTNHIQLQIPYEDHGYAATAVGRQKDLCSN